MLQHFALTFQTVNMAGGERTSRLKINDILRETTIHGVRYVADGR